MKQKRFNVEQIVAVLKQAEAGVPLAWAWTTLRGVHSYQLKTGGTSLMSPQTLWSELIQSSLVIP